MYNLLNFEIFMRIDINFMDDNTKEEELPKEKDQKEIGGYKGMEPTKYGDWQHKGRTTDF